MLKKMSDRMRMMVMVSVAALVGRTAGVLMTHRMMLNVMMEVMTASPALQHHATHLSPHRQLPPHDYHTTSIHLPLVHIDDSVPLRRHRNPA